AGKLLREGDHERVAVEARSPRLRELGADAGRTQATAAASTSFATAPSRSGTDRGEWIDRCPNASMTRPNFGHSPSSRRPNKPMDHGRLAVMRRPLTTRTKFTTDSGRS